MPASADVEREYFVTARTDDDMAYAFELREGIAPWRYNVPTASWDGPYVAHVRLDRRRWCASARRCR